MPSRRRRPSSLPAVLAGVTLLVSACSTSTPGAARQAAPAGPGGAGDDSVVAMLGLLPPAGPDELGVVTVSRWHAAADAYGIAVPAAGAPSDDLLHHLSRLTVEGGLIQGSALLDPSRAASASTEEQFGFGLRQISADVSAGLPPRQHHAARGDFDPDAVVEATRSGPVADDVEEVDVQGVPVLRWRGDLDTDLGQVNALSPVGGAGRLGLPDDSTLLYAGYDDGMAGLVEAQQGGASLADDEDLAAVAAALDAEGVLSAQLTHRPDGSDLAYATVGIGYAPDGGGRVVLAYSTGSESDARAVASAVEELVTAGRTVAGNRPWSDLLGDPDIRADGSLVTATFAAVGPAGRWPTFLYNRENLF